MTFNTSGKEILKVYMGMTPANHSRYSGFDILGLPASSTKAEGIHLEAHGFEFLSLRTSIYAFYMSLSLSLSLSFIRAMGWP